MKQLIITLFIVVATLSVKAQAPQQPPPKARPVIILLADSSNLVQLQSVLQFSYQFLSKSSAPANQVEDVKNAIQQLYPMLVPLKKDSTIKVKPNTKAKQ